MAKFKDQVWHKLLGRPYKLHYIDHGGDGPVMIFLHGLASSSANWEYLIPLLRPRYRCISIDLVGFGDSPKPQWYDYNMNDHLVAIQATIRSLHLRRPFTLVGHSLGSLIATRYSRFKPNRVSRLVLLSPPAYMPAHMIGSRAARQRTSMYLRAYRFIRTHPRITPENVARLLRILPQAKFVFINRETWIPFVRSLERCIEQQTLIEDIKEIESPIDIFFGTLDEVVVPYNVRQLATLKDVTLHQLHVNHAVGKRYAAAVAKVLAPGG